MKGLLLGAAGCGHLRRMRPLLAGFAVVAAMTLPAAAQDATWRTSPVSNAFGDVGNWTADAAGNVPAGTVPTGTAFFGASNTTALTFLAGTTNVGGWTFNAGTPGNPGASAYTFNITDQLVNFTGAGIVVNGGSATITNDNVLFFHNGSAAGSATIINNSGLTFFNTSTAGSATITNNNLLTFGDNSTAGSAIITNNNLLSFVVNSTAGNARLINNAGGTVDLSASTGPNNDHKLSAGSIEGAGNFFLGANELTVGSDNRRTTVSGVISDWGAGSSCQNSGASGGSLVKVGTGALTLSGANTYTGATTVNLGTLNITGSIASNVVTVNGGELQFASTSSAGSASITNKVAGSVIQFFGNSTAGNARLINSAGSSIDFSASSGLAGNNKLTAGSIEGGGFFLLGGNELTVGGNNLSTNVSGVISDCGTGGNQCFNPGASGGSLVKAGTGTLTLSGVNTYTGATTVNGGTLEVDGSIGMSSLASVNSGGALTGVGTVGATQINAGGTLAPGNTANPTGTLAIAGNLAFQSGALYLVQLNPTTSSFATVTGAATLNGATVNAIYANGSYVSKQYTILNATGGVSGTFGSLVNTNLPSNFTTSLSYNANNAFLNLTLNFTPPPPSAGPSAPNFGGGLNVNQQNVGNALINFFNTTGSIPLVFGTLLPAGLSQALGETAAGSQQATFDAMTQFMGVMTDPFMAGRGDAVSSPSGAPGFAEETGGAEDSSDKPRSTSERDAYGMLTKAPLAQSYDPRWSAWGAGYGGSQTTDGNAAVGSNSATSRIGGTAVGADYRFSPFTIAGFALGGGATQFSVANGGSGRSDLFQAGAFVKHTVGPAYISGALAYGWQDITTNRTVTVAGIDQLQARFNANAYSGRVEGGYRFVSRWIGGVGLTPYAAGQFTTFDLPAYAEQAIVGSNQFALAYGSKSVTDSRSEFGLRADKSFEMSNGVLTLRGRFAWAYDFNPDRNIAATFQALPGASFVVNGAAQAHDSALTTASAEMKWLNGWSAAATFEGEFSDVTRSYAGKGVVRYAW